MSPNAIALILAIGDPGVADPQSPIAIEPLPALVETGPAGGFRPDWVFANHQPNVIVANNFAAIDGFDHLFPSGKARRARARLANLVPAKSAGNAEAGDVVGKQWPASAKVQSLVPAARPGKADTRIVLTTGTGRDNADATSLAGRTKGFVRMGSGDGGDILWREDDGLFYVSAKINGATVRLIVDTGASYTVLSPEDARRIGVDPAQITFAERAETAAGSSPMARIVLANLEIGQNVAAGVPAMVASGPLRTSLLGQNVLSRLGSVTIEGDRMTLR